MVYLAPGEAEVRARRSYALRGIAGARRGARDTGAAVKVVHSIDDPVKLGRRLGTLLSDPTGEGARGRPPSSSSTRRRTTTSSRRWPLRGCGCRRS